MALRFFARALLIVAMVVLIAACGGDDDGKSGSPSPTGAPTTAPPTATLPPLTATPPPTTATVSPATATVPPTTATPAPPSVTPTQTRVGGRPPEALPPGPDPQEVECDPASDRCDHARTSVFAIAHSFNDPDNTVVYRVTVDAAPTGTDWGDGTNGFFYQATVNGGTTSTYVPFNGVGVGDDNRPMLPQFIFIVSAGDQSTTLEVDLCASDYQNTSSPCTKRLWTDTYTSLPVPSVGAGPADDPFGLLPGVLFSGETGSSVSVANNGVHAGVLEVCPASNQACVSPGALSAEQLQWFYDHLVFFDENANPYTNDIFDDSLDAHRSIGVLTLQEAAFPISATEYRTRYGSTTAITTRNLPSKQFFFYTTNTSTVSPIPSITVGVQYLYDDDCNGKLNSVGCGSSGITTPPSIRPAASVTPETMWAGNVVTNGPNANAGTLETRSVEFESRGASENPCTEAVNPLAVNPGGSPSDGSELQPNWPNYVIDDQNGSGSWGLTFSRGLYYVLPAGFGNCETGQQPFCERTSGYAAYVPHYTPEGGQLNGGSTDQPFVDGFILADQYQLPGLSNTTKNALIWFDNCGYGYVYDECGSGCTAMLGMRKATLPLPSSGTPSVYTVENKRPGAVVFGKECCASFYQQEQLDADTTVVFPPVQIHDGYGIFIGPNRSAEYETLFPDEAVVVYDAATGNRQHKLRLNPSASKVYACGDSSCYGGPLRDDCPSVTVSAGSVSHTFTVDLVAASQGSIRCAPIGDCPFGTTTGNDGLFVTCTTTNSSFVLGIPDWIAEVIAGVDAVQLRAWGGVGPKGSTGAKSGGGGGSPGFALTVRRPSELPEALYVYAGPVRQSTVVSQNPLSSLSIDFSTIPPDPGPIYLVAGGGGQGGYGGDQSGNGPTSGGGGGVAIANASPSGSFVSKAGAAGGGGSVDGSPGGGGNTDGHGAGGSGGDFDGTKGGTGGKGVGGGSWSTDGSLIPPKSWSNGTAGGGEHAGGSGGGGFGGGGGGAGDNQHPGPGGGGAGSWASGNTVSDPTGPPFEPNPSSPTGAGGAAQLAYLAQNRAILYRLNAAGGTIGATDGGPPWADDSLYLTSTGQNTASSTHAIDLQHHKLIPLCSFDTPCGVIGAGAPQALFQTERYDPSGGSEMQYAFPVTNGDTVVISLFLAETDAAITNPGQRVFNVKVEGSVPGVFSHIDQVGESGAGFRGVRVSYLQKMGDNTLNLEFDHVTENPAIKGIEIRSLRSNFVSRGLLTSTRQPRPSECLTLDDTGVIVSNGGNFHLVWQDDGDLAINNPQGLAIWRAGTDHRGSELCFESDGNLEIHDASGTTLFETATPDGQQVGNGGTFMSLQDNCNLEIIRPARLADQVIYQTNTTCSTTPLATFTPAPPPSRTPFPPTLTPTATRTGTPTRTFTQTHTVTVTRTVTATHTQTPTRTFTPTSSPTFTATPTFTPTFTPQPTSTSTPTPTAASTPTVTPTETPTPTVTPIVTPMGVEVFAGQLTSTNHSEPTECLQLPDDQGTILDNGVAKLNWESDGRLVIRTATTVLFASQTSDEEQGGNGGRELCFPDSLIIKDGEGNVLFSSNTPTGASLRLEASCNLAIFDDSGGAVFGIESGPCNR